MVQPYPSTGKPVEAQGPPAPKPVLQAVKLMYAGAAISTVSLIISLADIGGIKAAIKKAHPNYTASQISGDNRFIIGLAVVSGLLGIGLWLWMARSNSQGKNWARILSTFLFGLATLDLVGVFSEPQTALGLVFPVLTWLVGLGAIWLLWRRESTEFFKAQRFV
jgi:hypothetical protein